VRGCVRSHSQHNNESSGSSGASTLLSRNLYAIMFNAAARKGHSNIASGLESFNSRLTGDCFEKMSAVKREYDSVAHAIDSYTEEKHVSAMYVWWTGMLSWE
jgi:hypothetical protein